MQATATTMTSPRDNEQARLRALIRFNGVIFHTLAVASFLETAAPRQVNRLAQVYGARPDVRQWLEQVWWPLRVELGRQLRGYIEATWPEFDWGAAYEEFCAAHPPRSGVEGRAGGTALETLALCVASAQAALVYRSLAACADDPALRALAGRAAAEHAGHFDALRPLFERMKRDERVGFAAGWRAVAAVCRSSRDGAVAAALKPLADNWKGVPVAPVLGYPEYRSRMTRLIEHYVAPGWIERLLVRPWLERERPAPARGLPALRPTARAEDWARATPQPA
jgi:hypothetical protein